MNRKVFFDEVRRRLFRGSLDQKQVDGLNRLIDAWSTYGDGDDRKLSYTLGTAKHETANFVTMEEFASGAAYEGRMDLGNTERGDGKRFKGRGYIQITGRRNYADWARRLGVDIVAKPELAMDPAIAARICIEGMMRGTFTGRSLGDYIGPAGADYRNARRVVNGMDRADLIAGYAREFEAAIRAARAVETDHQQEPEPVEMPEHPKPANGLGAVMAALFLALFGRRG